jgi:ABC-type antimicrobial peptide transport system permease subunit
MGIKAMPPLIGFTFIGLWIFIFLIPFIAFTQSTLETVEECRDRILEELPNTINNTENMDKVLDKECNPKTGGFAKIPEFANWLNNNLIAWFFVSFLLAVVLYVILVILIGFIALIIYFSNIPNSYK